jgi:ssDNA-binding Zn-finger/Zn-ribbon topoisomerase 1
MLHMSQSIRRISNVSKRLRQAPCDMVATWMGGKMGALEDLRNWLKEIPLWQELGKVPDRMTALEARMTAMEERLKTQPGEACPKCGEHTMSLDRSGRVTGGAGKQERNDIWKCANTDCGHSEHRIMRL